MANGTQAVRLSSLERDGAVQNHRLQTIEDDVRGLGGSIKELRVEIGDLRKTILAFAFTIAGSAVLIAATLAFISKP